MQAALLSQTGGDCECDLENRLKCDTIPAYAACKEGRTRVLLVTTLQQMLTAMTEVRRDLVTATAAVSGMATIAFGALTNLPVAIA
jgi:adenine/guanine/hypoxanthine permease